jgi:WS/DGAT/MGAT family acyltransferase
VSLPAPGDDHQLALLIARLHARPLERSRPLWEVYLVTGLTDGRAAIYSKIHHAAIDGVAGDEVLAAVVDPSPRGRRPGPVPARTHERPPGAVSLLARSGWSLLAQPARVVRLGAGLIRSTPGLAGVAADRIPSVERLRHHDLLLPHAGLRAPHTPFNAPITSQRTWAFADLPLAQVKRVKDAAGVTVNDVVMALCAGALRRWLTAHNALPSHPLVAAVPVSIRSENDDGSFGNRLSAMLAALPTDVADPADRLATAAAAMQAAKSEHATIPPTLLSDATGFALPVLANPAWKVAARLRLMERANPFNLFISNGPGPRVPLYYAGALLLGYFPISAIAHGQGLNITVMSYRDRLCFGMLACRSLVPDLEQVAAWVEEELQLLLPDEPGTSATR